ncbi:MAG: hypothetical protein V4497_09380 [Bacteroidota bacterium]
MTNAEIYLLLGIGTLFFIGWLITCHLYSIERDRNIEVQKENTRLIEKNLELEEEVSVATKQWIKTNNKLSSALVLLDKKKDLLEIQDHLIQEQSEKIINYKIS